MVLVRDRTFAALLMAMAFTLFFVGAAVATDGNGTATPVVTPSPSPSPGASATPVPTPAPRQVFSSPRWDTDHVTITATNNGAPIVITAWIDNPSKKVTISVGAGETMAVSTPSIQAQNGQIVKFGFEATQDDTSIDSYSATITVNLGPTPTALPPETVTIAGAVVDADNGSPISGATVTFKSLAYGKTYPPVATGADGTFISSKMYPDEYTIRVTASGYQAVGLTSDKVTQDSSVDSIMLRRLAASPTPTPAPTPSPTPSLIDPWISLLYSPGVCLGSLSALVAIIAGSIGIWEWFERKRRDREAKGGEKKDDVQPPGTNKP